MKYRYFTNNKDVVICESSFAGKKVKGVAKCSPEDKFELDYGRLLSKARVDYKIATLKYKRAYKKLCNLNSIYWEMKDKAEAASDSCVRFHRKMSKALEALQTVEKLSKLK